MQGHLIPWLDFAPDWKGWRSLGLSPDTIGETSTVREEFLKRFENSVLVSVGASLLAVVIGSLAAYGLSRFEYKFGPWRNKDISFFFLSQLILPPVVLAMPFLVLYKELALLDTKDRPDPRLHADGAADRHLDHARPVRYHSRSNSSRRRSSTAARCGVHSCASCCRSRCRAWWRRSSSRWCCAGTNISSPPCSPAPNAKTLPVMVASQTGSQGINWWSMAALSTAAIAPLVLIGIFLERYIVKGLTAGAVK